MRSGPCNCFAIYDWEGDISPITFHEIARSLFDAYGVRPDVGSITLLGAEKNDVQEYSRLVAGLSTLQGSVDFYHTVPSYKQLVFGWDGFASLNTNRDKTMVFCFAQNLANLNVGYFEKVAQALAAEIQLKYGIGYQRSFELGPEMYAYGMVTGLRYSPRDLAEADRIGMWMRERLDANRHLKGYLRDVYPLNVLSSHHLARNVGRLPLAQWIEQSPNRGQLAQLSAEAWIWKIPEGQLADVRDELQEAGCTIVPPGFLPSSESETV